MTEAREEMINEVSKTLQAFEDLTMSTLEHFLNMYKFIEPRVESEIYAAARQKIVECMKRVLNWKSLFIKRAKGDLDRGVVQELENKLNSTKEAIKSLKAECRYQASLAIYDEITINLLTAVRRLRNLRQLKEEYPGEKLYSVAYRFYDKAIEDLDVHRAAFSEGQWPQQEAVRNLFENGKSFVRTDRAFIQMCEAKAGKVGVLEELDFEHIREFDKYLNTYPFPDYQPPSAGYERDLVEATKDEMVAEYTEALASLAILKRELITQCYSEGGHVFKQPYQNFFEDYKRGIDAALKDVDAKKNEFSKKIRDLWEATDFLDDERLDLRRGLMDAKDDCRKAVRDAVARSLVSFYTYILREMQILFGKCLDQLNSVSVGNRGIETARKAEKYIRLRHICLEKIISQTFLGDLTIITDIANIRHYFKSLTKFVGDLQT